MTGKSAAMDEAEIVQRLTVHLTQISEEAVPEEGLVDRFVARIEQAGKATAEARVPWWNPARLRGKKSQVARSAHRRSWHPRTLSGWLWAAGIAAVVLAIFPDPFYSTPDVLSNISTGLQAGGPTSAAVTPGTFGAGISSGPPDLGGAVLGAAGSAVGAIGSVAGSIVSHGGGSSPSPAHSAISAPGNLPANEQRAVALGYIIPDGSFVNSFNRIESIATGLGGYVSTSTTSSDGGQRVVSGTMVVEIPSSKLARFFDGIPSSFTATYVDFSVHDYSSQVAQAEAKIKVDQQSLAGFEEDLATAKAANSTQYSEQYLEAEIATLQNEIATETASLQSTSATVATTPVTVSLAEAASVASPPSPFVGAVLSGWSNIVGIVSALVFILLTLLPFLLIGAGLYFLLRRHRIRLFRTYRERGNDFVPPVPSVGDGK